MHLAQAACKGGVAAAVKTDSVMDTGQTVLSAKGVTSKGVYW